MASRIEKWGYPWEILDDGMCFCLQPVESGIFCGVTPEQLENIKYMKSIGMNF